MRRKEDTIKGKYAKATVNKYLKALLDDGLMEIKLSIEYRFKPVYHITEEGQLAFLEMSLSDTIETLGSVESLTAVLLQA